MMQRPRGQEVLRGIDGYERMVDAFAQNARAYWGMWGPLGEPMVRGVEAWARMKRAYLQWLRQTPGARASASFKDSRYQEGDSTAEERSAGEVAQELTEEAHRIAIEAQREAGREEAEGSADEALRSPERGKGRHKGVRKEEHRESLGIEGQRIVGRRM